MNIHEYQAKDIFRQFGIEVPSGRVFDQSHLTLEGIRSVGSGPFVVKAQVHAGGRGKAGGIKIVPTAEAAFEAAKSLLGQELVTYQTGGRGKPVDHVLVEPSRNIAKEIYLAVILDRERALPCVVCSDAGGVDIETIARQAPEKILKFHFDPDVLPEPHAFEAFFQKLNVPGLNRKELAGITGKLCKLFVTLDASLVEVNPLGLMQDKTLVPIDAKINFDVNALFRHPEIAALYDPRQVDTRETEAKKFDLSYVGLDGNIGCMVNGAGLAMATMDLIKFSGGEPANFLDVGGGATKEKVAAAFEIILKDTRVKAILVNIFGGIMRCDVIAKGILAATAEKNLKVPLVVRLEGTNVKEGKELIQKSKLSVISADSFEDGAKKVVARAKGKK